MPYSRVNHNQRRIPGVMILIAVVLGIISLGTPASAQEERVSRFGVYQGYSTPIYTDWVRTSQYVTVRDGTKLAVDIFRPAVNGVPSAVPHPVIWTHHRYHRADVNDDGTVRSMLDRTPELQEIILHGYVIAAVDVRGGGASYGTRRGPFSPEETQDAYDITEWLAVQPWSTGNIGMYGLSYLGITQYMAASTKPPHLKAIFPMMALFDFYEFIYPGGIFHSNFTLMWGRGTFFLDRITPAAPVDEDFDGSMLQAAIAAHQDNWNVYDLGSQAPYRDSVVETEALPIYTLVNPAAYLDEINASGVAIYHLGGWYDMYPRDALKWFNNLTVPQKIVITPWSHNGSDGFDLTAEHLRWFDYWLKGIDNGIMNEPPMTYYVMGAPPETAWRTTTQWPLPHAAPTVLYLGAGPAYSVASVNDGMLQTYAPTATSGQDQYVVDYTTTTGSTTRWTDGYSGGFGYPDMTGNDQKGLTYTSPPLTNALEVTGHPVAHLWVSTTTADADFMVYLEEVDANGVSHYITEGVLRASHRTTADAPWHMIGLPYHRGLAADVVPLVAGEPVELVFDLHPTSNIFEAGHRIRVTITGADANTYFTPELDPPPIVSIYRNVEHASTIVLPIIP